MKEFAKRWQWWVALIILSAPLSIYSVLHYTGVIVGFIGEKLQIMDCKAPKWIERLSDWGKGE